MSERRSESRLTFILWATFIIATTIALAATPSLP